MRIPAVYLCVVMTLLMATFSINAATYIVTKTADTSDGMCDSDCSLREAILAANTTVDNDTIVFALPFFSSPRTITLASGELTVANNGSLTILGTGANRLTISGNNSGRILVSGANVVVNIYDLRFTAGNGVGTVNSGRGGAIYNVGGTMLIANSILTGNSAANGGAINNSASASPSPVVPANLTIDNCIISNNSSTSSGGAMQNFSTSTLHMRNTTVTGNNSASTGIAGAFQANGMVTITNSTFSGNTAAAGTGGGIYYNGTLGLVMTNTTLTNNSCAVGGGGLHRTGTTAIANVRNTIIADNTGAAGTLDVSGTITSQGNNIIESVGTSTGWVMSDQQNVDPLLAPPGFYGGFGMTQLPLAASTAINMGDNCVLTLTCSAANPPSAVKTDQRGAARPFGANVDVGAVEASSDYVVVLPNAFAGVPYNLTLVPANNGFTYLLNSGSFGGIALSSSTSTTLTGTTKLPGFYNGLVQMTGAAGQAFQTYTLTVLSDPNSLSITGRVLQSDGTPLTRARVLLNGINGPSSAATTNGLGYFRMDGLPAGLAGTLTVGGKIEKTFDPKLVVVSDVISYIELRANP